MGSIANVLIFICFLAFVVGEIYLITLIIRKAKKTNLILKIVIGIVAILIVNAPYLYVAEFRSNIVGIFGLIEAILLAFYGVYRLFQDYYYVYKRKHIEE